MRTGHRRSCVAIGTGESDDQRGENASVADLATELADQRRPAVGFRQDRIGVGGIEADYQA